MQPKDEAGVPAQGAEVLDIQDLLELCEKATPEPWEWQRGDPPTYLILAHGHFQAWGDGLPGFEDDKAFIAAARTALPIALRRIQALEAQVGELKKEREALKYEPNGQLRAILTNEAISEILAKTLEYKRERNSLREQLAAATKEKLVEVAAAVIEKDGLFRIFRRGGNDSYTGKWEFPGGKLEAGESPQDALKREIREELCIDCVVGDELDHYWYKYPKRGPISLRFFAVELLGAPEFTEHTESAWVRAEQLADYDLMNADMKFVATRLALREQLEQAREDAGHWQKLQRLVIAADFARIGIDAESDGDLESWSIEIPGEGHIDTFTRKTLGEALDSARTEKEQK